MNDKDSEKEVTIKLKKWQIPYLLGAARLGIWLEDWCAALVQSEIGTYDTHSGRWITKVAYIMQQIKDQTGVRDEDKEYATSDGWIQEIGKWIGKQCRTNEENYDKWEREEMVKEHKKQDQQERR